MTENINETTVQEARKKPLVEQIQEAENRLKNDGDTSPQEAGGRGIGERVH